MKQKIISNLSLVIAVIALILLFLPDFIFKKDNPLFEYIAGALIVVYYVVDLVIDIKQRKYSTAIFIIIIDILQIVAIIIFCILHTISVDQTNMELLWKRYDYIQKSVLTIIVLGGVKCILESKKFEIQHESL